MAKNIFIHDQQPSGTPLTGSYTFTDGTLQLPSGLVTPAPDTGGQVIYIEGSGLLMVASGTSWLSLPLS